MIGFGDLAVIVGLNLLGAASPGPDIILVTRTGTRSRTHAWATTLGTQTGVLLWCTLTVIGATALLNAFPWALEAVQVLGGAFLAWMGIGNVRSGWAERRKPPPNTVEAARRLGTPRASYIRGLTTNLANPKIVLGLSAMIAPLLPAHPSALTAVVVILALWLSSFALFAAYTQVISTERVRRRMLGAGPFIDIGAGCFFFVVGVVLFLRGALALGQ